MRIQAKVNREKTRKSTDLRTPREDRGGIPAPSTPTPSANQHPPTPTRGALKASRPNPRSTREIDKKCNEFSNLTTSFTKINDSYLKDLYDIEELHDKGRKNKFCPYYYTMKNKDHVDILMLPYNYLLEQNIMRILDIDLNNTTLIFDEAHNIEKTAEAGSSYEISTKSLKDALVELKKLESMVEESSMKKAKKMKEI